MIAHRNGTVVIQCDQCMTVLTTVADDATDVEGLSLHDPNAVLPTFKWSCIATDGRKGHLCGMECFTLWDESAPRYRCPDCVTTGEAVCRHGRLGVAGVVDRNSYEG